ncbi:hypothetical protein P7C70_g1898, partial [Phenoliferia sp. Uapishka_3]
MLVCLGFMAVGIVIFMVTSNFAAMMVARVLQGFSGTAIWTLGLALASDSTPETRCGSVMGFVMSGSSIGLIIGPPIGGLLYAKLGFLAPCVFALGLVAVDFTLRLLIIEKHEALIWIKAGVVVPGFEAPGYSGPEGEESKEEAVEKDSEVSKIFELEDEKETKAWRAILKAATSVRPLTNFGLTLLNAFILAGAIDTGLTLYVESVYGLDSFGAGLAFIAAAIPSTIVGPISGWLADRYGVKIVCTFGIALSIPIYSTLTIRAPLPAFIFLIAMLDVSLASFNAPNSKDLSDIISCSPGLSSTTAYGISNLMYSLGTFCGPIVAGEMMQQLGVRRGWVVLCAMSAVIAALFLPFAIFFLGGPLRPMVKVGKEEEEAEGVQYSNSP